MHWFIEAFKKYSVFRGRARRKEYWMFQLVYLSIFIMFGLLGMMTENASETINLILGAIILLFLFGTLVPTIAISVRRLHDTGRNGWWLLLGSVPVIGDLALLGFMIQDSEPDKNKYGPNPIDLERSLQALNFECEDCGHPVEATDTFCSGCGVELSVDSRFCTQCGENVSRASKYCQSCGEPLPIKQGIN